MVRRRLGAAVRGTLAFSGVAGLLALWDYRSISWAGCKEEGEVGNGF